MINGDIKSKRKMTAAYLRGFYTSTFFPDRLNGPFAADAIISNPPAFAHIHVAEALGIPLHMSFSAFVALPLVPSVRCRVVLLFAPPRVSSRPVRSFTPETLLKDYSLLALCHLSSVFSCSPFPPAALTVAMPWTPTTQFQHPLVTVKDSNAEPGIANHVSFLMAELL